MCQLLGLNSNLPTDICFSFTGFKARGGVTDHHADGWGIAFFAGRAARVFHDPQPSCSSQLAELVSTFPIHSTNIIGHIRKATHGDIRLENTHPFVRELWGRHWVFAHNGTLHDFAPALSGHFQPVGSTDSELAFCWLMQELLAEFGQHMPAQERLFAWLRQAAVTLSAYGVCNFLLSQGSCLFAHCSTRLGYLSRRAPFAEAHLVDADLSIDFRPVDPAVASVVVATVPLTDNEPWQSIAPGTLCCFSAGRLCAEAATLPGEMADPASPCG